MRSYKDIYELIYLNTKANEQEAAEYARYCHNHGLDGMDAIRYAEKKLQEKKKK